MILQSTFIWVTQCVSMTEEDYNLGLAAPSFHLNFAGLQNTTY